jgi:SnoaL-like domain
MSKHVVISSNEAGDRLAIRELIKAHAHCADRRDAKGQMSLLPVDTHFVLYMNAKDPTPSQDLHSCDALAPVFAELNKYEATTHFLGQNTILYAAKGSGYRKSLLPGTGITLESGKRRLMLASLRYLHTFAEVDGAWLSSERLLYVDWVEERALS